MIASLAPRHVAPRNAVHHTAFQAVAAGISVVPIRADGTKSPALAGWREYQRRRPDEWELERWFSSGTAGLACITGRVSGHLEALDFDDPGIFAAWVARMHADPACGSLYERLSSGYLEATPAGGRHLLYRCETIEGNQKLASRLDGDRRTTLIETRGEAGLLIISPSRGLVHPSGKPYLLYRGGVSTIRTITAHERALLFAIARSFDMLPPVVLSSLPTRTPLPVQRNGEPLRPGDLFNERASWEDVLLPHGWQCVRISRDGEGYWRRPGKRGPGISATTNHHGHDLLYVFSTATVFEAEKGYTKFHAYTLLNHDGNFTVAARALAESGYTTFEQGTR